MHFASANGVEPTTSGSFVNKPASTNAMIYSGVDPAKRSRSVIVRHGRYTSRQFFLQIPFFPRADYNGGLVSRWGWVIARHGRLETLSVRRAIARRARQRHHWAVRQNLEECRGEGAGEWEAIEHFLFVRQNHQIHRTALKNRRVRSHKTRSLKKNEPCEQLDLKFKLNFDIVCYFVLLKRNP